MTAVRHYAVFGGVLGSAFDFPELRPADGPADWTLAAAGDALPPLGELLGSQTITPDCAARLHRTSEGLALVYDDTGRFDLPADGTAIRWTPGARPDAAAMRTDVLGRCLALVQHQRGALALHASALQLGRGAIALVAPSGTGKSSLAFALVRQGARLLTDDTLPVELQPAAVLARPGVQSIRLREDSAGVVGGPDRFTPAVWGKREYRELPAESLAAEPVPLRAIYVLVPADPAQPEPVRAEALPGIVAIPALLGQHKLGALLGGSEARVTLARVGELVRRVPVRRLLVARDLARLPEAAATLAGWHAD